MAEIVRELSDLKGLAVAWNELAERLGTPLLRYEWFAACAEAFSPPRRLAVAVARSQGKPVAIAPLASISESGVETLQFLGASFLSEPSGLIYEDEDALEEVLDAVLALRTPVLFSRLRASTPEIEVLRRICQGRALVAFRNTAGSPWIPIATTWSDFETSISSKRRASFRRAWRRAEAAGKVEFEIASPAPENLGPHLDEIFRVEASGWKGRRGTAMLSKEPLRRFFELYSHHAAALRMLRLSFLRISGQAAAAQLAVEYAHRFWVLKIGYDEAWASCSPGILLMHETIRYAFERGLRAFEFLGADQSWMRVWSPSSHSYVTSRIYPYSVKAVIGCGIDMSRSLLRQLVHRRGIAGA